MKGSVDMAYEQLAGVAGILHVYMYSGVPIIRNGIV